jgi:hypothetical protein
MPYDRQPADRVATSRQVIGLGLALNLAVATGCGPRIDAEHVRPEPEALADARIPGQVGERGREVLLGEMCPQMAAGKPAMAPLVVRGVRWEADPTILSGMVERAAAPRMLVLGYDGARAGGFDLAGVMDGELPQLAATGVYVGAPPCTRDAGGGARAEHPACNAAAKGCGLAIGYVDADDEREPQLSPARIGGACMAGDDVAVDIDGDGAIERYRLAAFLDEVRAPAERVIPEPAAVASCAPTFSIHGMTLAPGVEPGTKIDDQVTVGIDVLGVLDLDADGRREVILAIRYPGGRSIVVYAAGAGPEQTLERVGEAVAWS